jgi:hypothetical protein
MIISASRRTDIPAFYPEWFMNRIRAGHCCVVNPCNRSQNQRISLAPEDVDAVVFWTRNASPLIPYLDELDRLGFKYYFLYTITNYPKLLEKDTPVFGVVHDTIKELSARIGPERILWRYDPVIFTSVTDFDFHKCNVEFLISMLRPYVGRMIVSVFDEYRSAVDRLNKLDKGGVELLEYGPGDSEFRELFQFMSECAASHGLNIQSCAEEIDLKPFGILPGKCVDDEYIGKVLNAEVASRKDASQREICQCVQSKDIGAYDTCKHGCEYCYATRSQKTARKNYDAHNPESPSLVGWHDCDGKADPQIEMFKGYFK